MTWVGVYSSGDYGCCDRLGVDGAYLDFSCGEP